MTNFLLKPIRLIFLTLSWLLPLAIFAEVPEIPAGPDGTIYTCALAEDDYGCYGDIRDTSNISVRLIEMKRNIRREIRTTKRERREARYFGDFESVLTLTDDISLLKSVRRSSRQCFRYDDPDCSDSGSGGGKGGEIGGGNSSVAEACNALGDADRSRFYNRIVNGALCTRGNSPIVPILYDGDAHCTGSVIAANVVVTAAHCVVDTPCSALTVTSGSGVTRSVSSCPSHPSYDGYSEDNDVALLILNGNLDTDVIKLHTTADIQVGEKVAFAGYGRNEDEDYENLRATFNYLTEVTNGSLVVEYSQGQSGIGNSCNGDSGGPLAVERDGEWVLIGAVSNGDAQNCALPGYESSDVSRWANLTSSSNRQFIADYTSGIVD